MNTNDKLVAAAKRAARAHSRTHSISYQRSLDIVAQQVGRPTWKAFLANPAPVDEQSINAASEPDFSTIPPGDHITAIIRHARQINAYGFTVEPRSGSDASPVLSFTLTEAEPWPIDARGLSVPHLVHACLPETPMRPLKWSNISIASYEGMPTIDGALMRTIVSTVRNVDPELYGISATIDGTTPVSVKLPEAPDQEKQHTKRDEINAAPSKKLHKKYYGRRPSLIKRMRHLVLGQNETAIRRMIEVPLFTKEEGPFIAVTPKARRLRFKKGLSLLAFSPPGTGRMSGVTIPALLSDDQTSYIVHDDGQLLMHTSGWRSTLGHTAVIRLDGDTRDAINPFSREWLPKPRLIMNYVDRLASVLIPNRPDMTRLFTEEATALIRKNGETTLLEIRNAIAPKRENDLAREVFTVLLPLTSPIACAATSKNTITPNTLRGKGGKPTTIYIVRDVTGSRDRHPLAALIQEAIWQPLLTENRTIVDLSVNTIIHDFERMPKLPSLLSAMAMARSYDCGIILSGSTARALEDKYGEDAMMILSKSHLTLILEQGSPQDLKILDPNNVIDWHEAATLGQGNCIALPASGGPPARLRTAMFFEHTDLKRRVWDPRTKTGMPPIS